MWTCCEKPPTSSEALNPVATVNKSSLSQQAAESLHWVDLVSGQFFQDHNHRFQRSGSADQMLLSNLKEVRWQLREQGLDQDTIHDLLARIIFIQFLSQRRDSAGNPALTEEVFKDLHRQGILSSDYKKLSEILENRDDVYKFFRWLNDKFNGDLFPGKGATEAEREAEWQAEIQKVDQGRHLGLLRDFVRGDLRMKDGQLCLWPQYSFDAIPLDFISSIYEEFVSKESNKGVHYTPEHLVDFILDGVLPWNSKDWDLKILDPACGSGIFLVKAFQRLIYRWKNAHPDEEIKPSDLRSLLENNLFGIDINRQAVRVASFSLYLTMCDEIDPRHYWQRVHFPRLRDRRLVTADFFREDIEGFRTNRDVAHFDLAVGNAPWGKNSVTPLAKAWAGDEWKITYGNIGPLFLPKTAALTKLGGKVAMMQPASVLIFNQIGTAKDFRRKLFSEFKVEEIVNLSTLRFGLFKDAISPACIITMHNVKPDGAPLYYICPKPVHTSEDDYHIVIEPQDINTIHPQEAIADPLVWTALMWGGRRDLTLVRRLSQALNLEKLEINGVATSREGVIRGDRRKLQERIIGRRTLESTRFPDSTFLSLSIRELPINNDPSTDSRASTDFTAFEMPQMILKQGWQKSSRRFHAVITESGDSNEGIICSQSYISIHIPKESRSVIESACLSYNSKLSVYYLLLSSGRFASYRPEPTVKDLMRVPIPEPTVGLLQNIKTIDDVDQRIREAFLFKDSEWMLINDLFNYTLPDFKGDSSSPGRRRTYRQVNNLSEDTYEPELNKYCEYFLRVLKAGFGQDKTVCATIFQEQTASYLPVRLVIIHLNPPIDEGIQIVPIDSVALLKRLETLNELFLKRVNAEDGGIFYQRVARVYDSVSLNGLTVPSIYLVKPDKIRYWTCSMALRDADEVAADLMLWRAGLNRESLEVTQESHCG